MDTGGNAGGTRHVHDTVASLAVLTGTTVCGLVLAWSTVPSASWGAGQTALALTICGIAQAELARYHGKRAAQPVVSALAVWIIGAVLALPLAGVLLVLAVLHTHDLFRGNGPHLRRVVASTAGATLGWLVVSATTGILGAGLAGLLYLAATNGRSLLRRDGTPDFGITSGAVGVLLGLFAAFSPVAVVLVVLPVAYLQRAARGHALRQAAARDPKTQLWNHAAWQKLSSAALASHRTRTRSAVLMVDLDHFKRLNDTYGHQAGDDVLTSVAHVLQTTTRRNDIVARFGGEEFSILLPGVTEQEACQAAERIRDQIAALTVITTNLHGRPTTISGVTASIGVATTHNADACVDDLLVHADRWLYQAKESGRNRVCGPVLAAA